MKERKVPLHGRVKVAGEVSQGDRAKPTFIFHHQPIKLWLQVEVREEQMDAAAWFRDNQPHTIQVVAVLLRVVWREYGSRRSREVKETGDCEHQGIKDTGRSEQTTIKHKKRKKQNELHSKEAVRTHTAGFVARPLVIVLTCDSSLSH